MEKNIMAIITVLVFGAMITFALLAWRKRISQQENSFSSPREALDFFGELLTQTKCLYVATTFANNHLERIAAYGLGARGFAQILVFSEGILVLRNGERPLAIHHSAIRSVSSNQVAIDKTVESGGLISIDWIQDATILSTHLRIVDPTGRAKVLDEVANLCAGQINLDHQKPVYQKPVQSKDVIK